MTNASLHACPGPDCPKQVRASQLACRRHWFQVSAATRSMVWSAWASGLGAGTAEHRDAMVQAISEMKP